MNIKAINRLIIFGFFLCSAQMIFGQGYQRIFDADTREIYSSCSTPAKAGGYYLVNTYSIVSEPDSTGISVSKHDLKGTVMWSREYYAEDVTYFTLDKSIECATMGGDTLAIVAVDMEFSATSDDKLLYIINPDDGSLISYTRIIDLDEEFEDVEPNIFTELVVDYAGNLNYFGTHNAMDTIAVHHEKMDTAALTIESNSYYGIDSDTLPVGLQFFDAKTTRDSGYVFTAALEQENEEAAVVKINEIGQVELANVYSPVGIPNGQLQFRSIAEVADSSYVALGYARSMGDATNDNFVLVRLDTIGNVMWHRNIKPIEPGVTTTLVDFKEVIQTRANEIIIAGKYTDFVSGEKGEVAVFFDMMGTEIRQTSYTSTASVWQEPSGIYNALDLMNASPGNDGSDNIMITSAAQSDSGRFSPMVIKMNAMGATLCNQIPTLLVGSDTLVMRDTFAIEQSRFAQRVEMDTVTVNNFTYQVPIVVLEDTTYCPNVPIMYEMDATVDVGDPLLVSYLWNTDDTTAVIIAMEEGEYQVTVTVNREECFTLCDTAMITVLELPAASVRETYLCVPDEWDLTVQSSTDIAGGVIWSTGATTPSINVPAVPGTLYSVTITDSCNNTSETEVSIDPINNISNIFIDDGLLCTTGQIRLDATTSSQFLPLEYLWSNGATDRAIIVDPPGGTFSVTITDRCGNLSSADVMLTAEDFIIPDPTIGINGLGLSPTACAFELQAIFTSDPAATPAMIEWSTGSTNSNIFVDTPGTYTVTVTDACGQIAEASATVSESDLVIPPPVVEIQNLGLNPCTLSLQATASAALDGFTVEQSSFVWTSTPPELLSVSGVATVEITEPGTYTIEVTDNCGNTASAFVVISADDLDVPDPTISIDNGGLTADCLINLVADGEGTGGVTYMWNTQATNQFLTAIEAGTYTVTVTDACGQTAETSVTLVEADFIVDGDPSVTIDIQDGEECDKTLTAIVEGAVGAASIQWSTGETTPSIMIEDNGSYSVTVTANCGKTDEANLDGVLVGDLEFPNVFFPVNTLEEGNESFGPYIECDLAVSDYSLEVFNRWGKRVFEADNPLERWSGTLNSSGSSFLDEDVYMWQCFYMVAGTEQSQKGSVTLVRK